MVGKSTAVLEWKQKEVVIPTTKYITVKEIISRYGELLTWSDIEKLSTFTKIKHNTKLKVRDE